MIAPMEQPCEACQTGQQRRTPFPAQAQYRADAVLKLMHGDLCGKITPPTPAGNQYFLLLVDDRSRFMSAILLPSKDQAPDAIKHFQFRAEAETGKKLGGAENRPRGEFNSADFLEYCVEQGVRRQLSAAYSPQQNGVVERRNGTVVGTARCMLKAKNLTN
jgi:hypothetical protein